MLGRGELRCIGATTLDEYRKYIEKDPALERRFQQVYVDQPSVTSTIAILRGLRERYNYQMSIYMCPDYSLILERASSKTCCSHKLEAQCGHLPSISFTHECIACLPEQCCTVLRLLTHVSAFVQLCASMLASHGPELISVGECRYELHHGVRINDTALVEAAIMSDRYIADRFLPDKAIDLIDEAAAKLKMEITSKPLHLDEIDRKVSNSSCVSPRPSLQVSHEHM